MQVDHLQKYVLQYFQQPHEKGLPIHQSQLSGERVVSLKIWGLCREEIPHHMSSEGNGRNEEMEEERVEISWLNLGEKERGSLH